MTDTVFIPWTETKFGKKKKIFEIRQTSTIKNFNELNLKTLGNGVTIDKSNISEAGYGVFTTQFFGIGEIITEYEGLRVKHKELLEFLITYKKNDKGERIYPEDLISHAQSLMFNRWTILGNRSPENKNIIKNPQFLMKGKGVGAYINDARLSKFKVNVQIMTIWDREANDDGLLLNKIETIPNFDLHYKAVVVALVNINKGTELFTSYGNKYWERMNEGTVKRTDLKIPNKFLLTSVNETFERKGKRRIELTPIKKDGNDKDEGPKERVFHVKKKRKFECNFCDNIDNLKCCSQCKNTYYCDKICQKKDWNNHKKNCFAVCVNK